MNNEKNKGMDVVMDNFKKQLEKFNLVKLREMGFKYCVKNYQYKNKEKLIEGILHQMYVLMH